MHLIVDNTAVVPHDEDVEAGGLSAEELFVETLEARLAKAKLKFFVKQAWKIVEPDTEMRWNWHLDEICEALEAVTRGEITHLLVNVPPGTMKSLLVNVMWPCWEWASNQSLRYLTASYGSTKSVDFNLKTKQIVMSPWYQRHFPIEFTGDQNAKERFNTTRGGWRIATSVGGPGTGEHPDRVIVDDPLTAEQARSEADRRTACLWIDRTLSTRGVARGCRTVIIMQRLHEEDPSGNVLAQGGYEHIRFPMRYEVSQPDPTTGELKPRPDPRDHRKEAGELLWPELFDEKKVARMELVLGAYGAAGQLQQRPAPEGGGMFKKEWFLVVDAVPAGGVEGRGWDTASTAGGGDYTAGVRVRIVDGIVYVMHVERGQWGPHDVEKKMQACAALDGKFARIREEKEGGSAGKTVVTVRARNLPGYDYKGVPITGPKEIRANNFRAQAEAGNVRLVRGEWNHAYLDELAVFPNGSHDDQVDATSCIYNDLTAGPRPVRVVDVSWG